jgi:aminopeptidase N
MISRTYRSGLLLVLLLLVPSIVSAQRQRPAAVLHERLAESKAQRFERFYSDIPVRTANQASYDVLHYDLNLTVDPGSTTVTGSVKITAAVVAGPLSTAEIDLLDNMTVSSVTWTGGALSFSHTGDIVFVTLPAIYAPSEIFSFTINYSGTPDPAAGAFGFDTYNSQPMIWSLSEPFGARSWWPCKDDPSDKPDSVNIHITVPNTLTVASNGTLMGINTGVATDTYWWRESYPIATYLVSLAIHPYTRFSHWYHHSPTDSMEVQYYVFPDHYSSVQATYAKTVPMIETFAGLFGEYPFLDEKYGHAEFLWGGGMEHQTITSLGGWGEYLIAHELAHQWWGDMITCDDFHHIWMNEGFATYSEALWSESEYGLATYRMDMAAARYFGPGTIYVPDTSDWGRIFHSGLSYNKGSWVLHMLRHVVGDSTFFAILQTYYGDSRYQYASITTEQFRDLCEDVSGMELDWFFHQWIYEEYYPAYSYEWSTAQAGDTWNIDLTVIQEQSNYIFKMPVDIRVQTTAGEITLVVWDSLATQDFVLSVDDFPTGLQFDPDEWILRTVNDPLSNPTLDRGILVVNGVDWNTYGTEIVSAYEDSVFWGTHPITFWDHFDEPGAGYPANIPAPLGHGAVPPDTIQQFSAIVWVGNNYNGDITSWLDTPVFSFLKAGGNVLLMTRQGTQFIDLTLQEYLGITFQETGSETINQCLSTWPGLDDIALNSAHTLCAVFDTALTSVDSKLLFKETISFTTDRGLGVWHAPAAGGTHRGDGGQMVFISGRPYRYNHDDLRANVEYILSNFFGEPYSPATAISNGPAPYAFGLRQNYPNPFNPHTTIGFSVPERGPVTLRVYDVTGRLVTILADRDFPGGRHTVNWNGTNRRGESVASGIYFYKIVAGDRVATKKMLLLR